MTTYRARAIQIPQLLHQFFGPGVGVVVKGRVQGLQSVDEITSGVASLEDRQHVSGVDALRRASGL